MWRDTEADTRRAPPPHPRTVYNEIVCMKTESAPPINLPRPVKERSRETHRKHSERPGTAGGMTKVKANVAIDDYESQIQGLSKMQHRGAGQGYSDEYDERWSNGDKYSTAKVADYGICMQDIGRAQTGPVFRIVTREDEA